MGGFKISLRAKILSLAGTIVALLLVVVTVSLVNLSNINKKITPEKGKALIFFNCNYNKDTYNTGLCDIINNSKHAGLPVIHGKTDEKWIDMNVGFLSMLQWKY